MWGPIILLFVFLSFHYLGFDIVIVINDVYYLIDHVIQDVHIVMCLCRAINVRLVHVIIYVDKKIDVHIYICTKTKTDQYEEE